MQILIGNKSDLKPSEREVSQANGAALAKEFGIPFIETSAIKDLNVQSAFEKVSLDVVAAFPRDRRTALAMNRATDTAARQQVSVRRIHDGINRLNRDIAFDQLDPLAVRQHDGHERVSWQRSPLNTRVLTRNRPAPARRARARPDQPSGALTLAALLAAGDVLAGPAATAFADTEPGLARLLLAGA